MKFISNPSNGSITFFVNNRPITFNKSDEQYARAIAVFDLPENEQEDALEKIVKGTTLPNTVQEAVEEGFTISGSKVSYQGETLPEVLANKVLALVNENLPVKSFIRFWENLRQNPSYSSIRELYDFLAYKELPLTEDGCFLAYKGVNLDFWSVKGNSETRVIRGEVDSQGRILNEVGSVIEIERKDVCDDRGVGCAPGVHVGSLAYAKSWAPNVVVVKVNPKDVVSVPSDCSCQKCRCSQYEVVSSFETEIVAPVVDSALNPLVNEEFQKAKVLDQNEKIKANNERQELRNRVEKYINKKEAEGYSTITVRQIQNSFSPDYPAQNRILDIVGDLGYVFIKNGASYEVLIHAEEM